MKFNKQIEDLIEPIIKALGYELWGMELHPSGDKTKLRIYIDALPQDEKKGVTIDDCIRVSEQIGALFDVENPIKGTYTLEVSSPGLDRPLFKIKQYERYLGNLIRVHLQQPINGRRNFAGKIKAVFVNKLELLVDDEVMTFEFENINKANLLF